MADINTELAELAARAGQESRALRTLINGNLVDLSTLTTTAKGNLVAAINELVTDIGTIEAGGIADGDKGSITVSGTGSIWTIDTGAVTNDMLAGSIADAKIASAATWNAKQAALVSGTNIKTINGTSLLGSGDITIAGSGGDALVANNLDQFAGVTQTSGQTLAITSSTTLAGGTHSGTNTGDQDLNPLNAAVIARVERGGIVAGTNVTITGGGLVADPYIINSSQTVTVASITGFGTGVQSSLGTNIGTTGAPVLFNLALGSPSSGTLTSCTGLPLTTGVTGTLPIANGGTGLTALGTALQVLRVNAGATALEYAAGGGGSGDLLSTNNLSDVASASTSRTNLGSGAVGDAVFVAATLAALQTAMGWLKCTMSGNETRTQADSQTYADVAAMNTVTLAADTHYRVSVLLPIVVGGCGLKAQLVMPDMWQNDTGVQFALFTHGSNAALAATQYASGAVLLGSTSATNSGALWHGYGLIRTGSSSGTAKLQIASTTASAGTTTLYSSAIMIFEPIG